MFTYVNIGYCYANCLKRVIYFEGYHIFSVDISTLISMLLQLAYNVVFNRYTLLSLEQFILYTSATIRICKVLLFDIHFALIHCIHYLTDSKLDNISVCINVKFLKIIIWLSISKLYLLRYISAESLLQRNATPSKFYLGCHINICVCKVFRYSMKYIRISYYFITYTTYLCVSSYYNYLSCIMLLLGQVDVYAAFLNMRIYPAENAV